MFTRGRKGILQSLQVRDFICERTNTTCSGLFKARRLWKGDSPLSRICQRRISDVPGTFFLWKSQVTNGFRQRELRVSVGQVATANCRGTREPAVRSLLDNSSEFSK